IMPSTCLASFELILLSLSRAPRLGSPSWRRRRRNRRIVAQPGRVAVPLFANGGNRLRRTAEDPALQPLGARIAKQAFKHVQPRRRSGSEVRVKARVHSGMINA